MSIEEDKLDLELEELILSIDEIEFSDEEEEAIWERVWEGLQADYAANPEFHEERWARERQKLLCTEAEAKDLCGSGLRKRRFEAGLSMTELAERSGLPLRVIKNLEGNKEYPVTEGIRLRLEKALGSRAD